jgi:hypothetical protein
VPAEYEVVLGQRPVLAVVCLPDALPAAVGAGDVIGRAPDHLERVNDNKGCIKKALVKGDITQTESLPINRKLQSFIRKRVNPFQASLLISHILGICAQPFFHRSIATLRLSSYAVNQKSHLRDCRSL